MRPYVNGYEGGTRGVAREDGVLERRAEAFLSLSEFIYAGLPGSCGSHTSPVTGLHGRRARDLTSRNSRRLDGAARALHKTGPARRAFVPVCEIGPFVLLVHAPHALRAYFNATPACYAFTVIECEDPVTVEKLRSHSPGKGRISDGPDTKARKHGVEFRSQGGGKPPEFASVHEERDHGNDDISPQG